MTVLVYHRYIDGVSDDPCVYSNVDMFRLRTDALHLRYTHKYRNRWDENIPRHLITAFKVVL